MDYKTRKALRTKHYLESIYKKKLVPCIACNGTGYYDSNNSPKCNLCNGKRKVKQD